MNLRAFVYEEPRLLARADFADYLDPSTTAVLSIDLHRGHLDASPECPCPAPRAAIWWHRWTPSTARPAPWACVSSM